VRWYVSKLARHRASPTGSVRPCGADTNRSLMFTIASPASERPADTRFISQPCGGTRSRSQHRALRTSQVFPVWRRSKRQQEPHSGARASTRGRAIRSTRVNAGSSSSAPPPWATPAAPAVVGLGGRRLLGVTGGIPAGYRLRSDRHPHHSVNSRTPGHLPARPVDDTRVSWITTDIHRGRFVGVASGRRCKSTARVVASPSGRSPPPSSSRTGANADLWSVLGRWIRDTPWFRVVSNDVKSPVQNTFRNRD
jgi:hypothetical protein